MQRSKLTLFSVNSLVFLYNNTKPQPIVRYVFYEMDLDFMLVLQQL